MKYNYEKKLKIKYVYIGLTAIFVLGLVLFFCLTGLNIKFGVIDVMAYATGSTAIFTLIYHALSLEQRIESGIAQNQIMRSQYTYDMISKWNTRELFESVMVFRTLLKDETNSSYLNDPKLGYKFNNVLDKDSKKRMHFVVVLNYCEVISSMVKKGDIDSELIRYTFRDLFVYYYKEVKHYIDFRQRDHPAAYYNFEELAKLWIKENKAGK